MSEQQPDETTVKAALFTVLAIGIGTLFAAVSLDPAPKHRCNAGTVEALFTPCDQRVTR